MKAYTIRRPKENSTEIADSRIIKWRQKKTIHATALDQLIDSTFDRFTKIIRDGQLYILRDGKTYNAQGTEL